jgi:ferric-dicitrate binding protein FerR (iron transport regulator)
MYALEESPKKKRNFLILAILVGMIGAGFDVWKSRDTKSPELLVQSGNFAGEISTRMGSRTRMVLPDSTVVLLNAGSKLTYNEKFGITNRNTTLSGEAFFDVKKSSIPFYIQANYVHIMVLGTAFIVNSYPNDKTTETCLIRGTVEVTLDKRPGEKFILQPNEKLIVANNIPTQPERSNSKQEPIVVLSGLTHSSDNSIIETSWIDNKLVFEDESFSEIAKKMERWFGVSIEFRSEKIASERLSGTFTTETIHQALERLQMTTVFQFTMDANKIIITP